MRGSVRLGRIAGIEIGIHYTWLLAFILFAWFAAQGFFAQQYPGWSQTTYWTMGVISSLLLFAAVLVHELAHSLVANARGMRVASITLFIFGGVSNLSSEANKPRTEFAMSIVGPLASLAIAAICWGLLQTLEPRTSPLAAMLVYLTYINASLGAFNLLPGFPLDGGRVLRSIIWGITGSLAKATNIATIGGRAFAWLFIGYGVFEILTGNFLGGLWIAFIGWFLNNAADASRREVTLQEQCRGVRGREVMDSNPATVSPQTSVSDVVREVFLQGARRAAAVSQNDHVIGIVTLNDVKHLPQPKWAETPVSEIMTREPLYTVDVDDDLNSAFKLLAQHSLNQVLVLHERRLAGVLSRADLIRYLQLSQELGLGFKKS